MPCLGIVNFLMMNRNNLYSYSHPWVSCSCSCSMLTGHTWAVGFIIWGRFQFSPLPTFHVALVITLQVQSSTRLHQVRWYISRKKWIGVIQVNKHVKTTREDGLHLNEVDEQVHEKIIHMCCNLVVDYSRPRSTRYCASQFDFA